MLSPAFSISILRPHPRLGIYKRALSLRSDVRVYVYIFIARNYDFALGARLFSDGRRPNANFVRLSPRRAYLVLTFLRSETVRASPRLVLGNRRFDPIKRIRVRCLSIFVARTEVELLQNGNALFLLAKRRAGGRVPLACHRAEPSSGSLFARSSRIKCRLRGWSWVNRTCARARALTLSILLFFSDEFHVCIHCYMR